MKTCAIRLVFRLTRSASRAASSPSCETRVVGGTRRKSASSGTSRNAKATAVAATHDRDQVANVGGRGGGQFDRAHFGAGGSGVRGVHEAGVRLAERHLAHDALYVLLLAD